VAFLPARHARELPSVGANTLVLPAQPFNGETVRALAARGRAHAVGALSVRRRRHHRMAGAAATEFGVDRATFERVTQPLADRAQRALSRYRSQLSGKRVFFMPDSQLELPLARFLHRELGMRWSKSARPTSIARWSRPSSTCCPPTCN
jgi:light-independent protochlorophyllide reductase subunit N